MKLTCPLRELLPDGRGFPERIHTSQSLRTTGIIKAMVLHFSKRKRKTIWICISITSELYVIKINQRTLMWSLLEGFRRATVRERSRPSSIDPSSFQRELCWNRRDAVPFPENDIYPPLPNTLTIKTNLRDFRIYINYFVYLLLKVLKDCRKLLITFKFDEIHFLLDKIHYK